MPAPPLRGNLNANFDCVELRFIFFFEPQCSCKFHNHQIFHKKPGGKITLPGNPTPWLQV